MDLNYIETKKKQENPTLGCRIRVCTNYCVVTDQWRTFIFLFMTFLLKKQSKRIREN